MIQEAGDGRYSFWGNVVYFSASDSSDPNTNGRSYTVILRGQQSPPGEILKAIEPARSAAQWEAPNQLLHCAVLGLGNRGVRLARLLARLKGVRISWLFDSSTERSVHAREQVGDPKIACTTELATVLADSGTDAVFVTLPDYIHRAAAEQAFAAGKNVFLEKPIATTAEDARAIIRAWKASGRVLQLGYVLRAAPFYQAIRNLLRQGWLGPVRIVNLSEHLELMHGASYMRRWHAQSGNSGGLIVHKACHDLDLACWLLDARPRHVSSFGGLSTFGCPPPAQFCSQCAQRAGCLYADRGAHECRTPAEQADPTAYGLDHCVFRIDKDIVDHQVVAFEMDTGVRGSFHLAMQGRERSERRITLIGDAGRLEGVFEDGSFTIEFAECERAPIVWSRGRDSRNGHGGGDGRSVTAFLNACLGRSAPPIRSVSDALAGLVFALSAEAARKSRSVVTLCPGDFELDG